MCPCQTDRLSNSYYFAQYATSSALRSCQKSEDKYRFVRWHPSGTLEFRFLCPCKHKIRNVKALMYLIMTYLSGSNPLAKSKVEMDSIIAKEKIETNYYINITKEKITL